MPGIGELRELVNDPSLTPEEFGAKLSELFKNASELGVEVEVKMMGDTKRTYFYINRPKQIIAYASNDGDFVISEGGHLVEGDEALLESLQKLGDSLFEEPLDSNWALVRRGENKVQFEIKVKGRDLKKMGVERGRPLKKYLESREYELKDNEISITSIKVLVPKKRLAVPVKIKTYQKVFLGGKATCVWEKIKGYSQRDPGGDGCK